MTRDRIERLVTLTGLLRERQLALLAEAVARRDAAMALREGLVALPSDDPAGLQAQAAYGQWVGHRRAALTAEIARHEERIAAETDAARRALARDEALGKLRDQLS